MISNVKKRGGYRERMRSNVSLYQYDWKRPNAVMVKRFSKAYDICYNKTEREIFSLFHEPISKEIIKSRIRKLNSVYHTRLNGDDIEKIATFLYSQGERFEDRIKEKNYMTVKELASRGANNMVFSFATKYCAFVCPDSYPIFDSMVIKVLNYFQREGHFFVADRYLKLDNIRSTGNYQDFVQIMNSFILYYGLNNCSYREVDKFLWLVGTNCLA